MLNKKSIAKLLVFAMILSMLPFSVFAAEGATTEEGGADSYLLTVKTVGNGTVSVDYTVDNDANATPSAPYYVGKDAKVTITATPDDGYKVEKAEAGYSVNGDTETIDLKKESDNVYTFTMPGAPVNVSVTFKEVGTPSTEYSISLDAETKTVEVGKTVRLNATVTKDNKPDTESKVTWTSDKPEFATVNENGVVTGVAKGTAAITAALESNPDVKAACTVTVTDATTPGTTHEVTVAKNIQNGTVTIAAAEDGTYKFAADTKVTVTATPDDGYKVGMVSAYKLDADAKPVGNVEVTGSGSTYTFIMPDANVEVTATFEKGEPSGNVIDEVDISMDITDLKAGYALPTATTTHDGVAEIQVKWFDSTDKEVEIAFPSAGEYRYEFTIVPKPGFEVAKPVNCTINGGKKVEPVTVVEKDPLKATWATAKNKTSGELTITGTSADKFYLIEVRTEVGTVVGSAYVLMNGGAKGSIQMPCFATSFLNVTELKTPDQDTSTLTPFVSHKQAGTLKDKSTNVAKVRNSDAYTTEANNAVRASDNLKATWATAKNKTSGELTITGTTEGMYYLIEVRTEVGTVVASAYILMEGTGGDIKIPCFATSFLNVTELKTPDQDTSTLTPFVSHKQAGTLKP